MNKSHERQVPVPSVQGVTIWEPRWTIMFPEFVNFSLNKESKILENGLTWYYKHTQCLDTDATLNSTRNCDIKLRIE